MCVPLPHGGISSNGRAIKQRLVPLGYNFGLKPLAKPRVYQLRRVGRVA